MIVRNREIEPLLTEKEVASVLNLSVATIRRRRRACQAPEWIKINSSVRYRLDAVQRFLADQERKSKEVR